MCTSLVFRSEIVDNTPVNDTLSPVCRTYTFPHCWVNVSLDGCWVQTVFHDNTQVVAMPNGCAEQWSLATRLGYGSDLAAMSREHEILHTFLSLRLRGGASPTLWAVAHGQGDGCAPLWEQQCEEAAVLAFQAYLNDQPWDDGNTLNELPLEELRAEVSPLLRL